MQSMESLAETVDWIEHNEQTWGEYFTEAAKLTFFGDYAEAEVNAAGVAGSVLWGMTGLDFYKDIADIVYSFHHWEWTWGHVANQGLNFFALLPVVGCVKNLKHADELAAAAKAANRLSDATKPVTKNLDEVASVGRNSINIRSKFPPGTVGAARHRLPSLPANARTAGIDEVYRRLQKYHGIDSATASERLHAGKQALGIPADEDLLFDLTGNVFDPVTRQWLFSLTTP